MSDTVSAEGDIVGRELPREPEWVGQKRNFNGYRKREKKGAWRLHIWPDEIGSQPRTCNKCGVQKTVQEFGPNNKRKDGIQLYCRPCIAASKRGRTDPEKCLRWHLKRYYGLTLEQYEEAAKRQDDRCGVCRRHRTEVQEEGKMNARRLSIDHDHETNTLRGLLCQPCNTALGLLKNNPALLMNAVFYLQAHKERINVKRAA